MTVAELIKELTKMPQDAETMVCADEDYGGSPSVKFYKTSKNMPYAKGWHPSEEPESHKNIVLLHG